jgi:hypothetical protein
MVDVSFIKSINSISFCLWMISVRAAIQNREQET